MDTTDIVNAVAAILFVLFLFAGFARTSARLVYYLQHRAQRPRLLNRDVVLIGGFAIPTGAILLVRWLGLTAYVRDNLLWTLGTDIALVGAVGTYAYYEWFVIEKDGGK